MASSFDDSLPFYFILLSTPSCNGHLNINVKTKEIKKNESADEFFLMAAGGIRTSIPKNALS